MPIHEYTCDGCAHRFDVMVTSDEIWVMDSDAADDECPECGDVEWTRAVSISNPIRLGGAAGAGKHYPTFDRGLGCYVESATHRDQICAQRGLIPIGSGDIDPIAVTERTESREADLDAAYEADVARQQQSPEVRKAQDLLARISDDKGMAGVHEMLPPEKSKVVEQAPVTSLQQTAPDAQVSKVEVPSV